MDWLVELLKSKGVEAEEVIEAVKAEFPKHAIPKDKYGAKVEELKSMQAEMEKMTASVAELSTKAGLADEVSGKLKAIESEYNDYKTGETTRLSTIEKKFLIEKELMKARAAEDAVDVLSGMFDIDRLTKKEDGTLEGFAEQLESVKAKRPSFFARTETVPNTPPPVDGNPAPINPILAGFSKAMSK
jgi:hypothetical protein